MSEMLSVVSEGLGMQVDKKYEIRPGPEDLPRSGNALRDLAGAGLGAFHGRVAQKRDNHVN